MRDHNIQNLPKIHNRYFLRTGDSFRNTRNMNKLSFTFCLYIWHAFRLTETPDQVQRYINGVAVRPEARRNRFITFNRDRIQKALRIINSTGLPSDAPSRVARTHAQRVRPGRTIEYIQNNNLGGRRIVNRPTPEPPKEVIPKHIIDDYIQMYTKLGLESKDCPICMENINGTTLSLTHCGHFFHKDCISKIRNNTCPSCRKNL